MNEVTEKEAWEACDRKNFGVAAEIWERLIASSRSGTMRDSLRSHFCYALVGLRRFDEARQIYQRLYDKTGCHIHVHQLGMVEREAGEYAKALALFRQEESMLSDDDSLSKAANLYELGLLESLIGNHGSALRLAGHCLAVSMKTEDRVMHGCALRLLGDLHRQGSPDQAKVYYGKSREAFNVAGDEVACREIDERMEALT